MSIAINIAIGGIEPAQRNLGCEELPVDCGEAGNNALNAESGPKFVKVRAKDALFCVMLDGLLRM
jgi:hypothetical protein